MRKNKGFTLIELLIVITIIGILTVLGARQFGNAVARANATSDLANAQTIANATRQALLMGELKGAAATGANTVTLAAGGTPADAETVDGTNKTNVAAIKKYLGSVPAIKIAEPAATKAWTIVYDVDDQSVTVKVNTVTLSPRPADSALGAWNVQ